MAGITTYTEAMGDKICELLMDGMSLRAICAQKDMPCRATVLKWLRDNEKFSIQYARAREEQAETLADEIIDIADDSYFDYRTGEDGNERFNGDAVQRSRLRVEARKWIASKLKPKKYGEKLEANLNHSGGITISITQDDANV